MSCTICGGSTLKDAPRLRLPDRLAGREACGPCGTPLGLLADGQLSQEGFDDYIDYLGQMGNQRLALEVAQIWSAPEAAARAAAIAEFNAELAAILITSGFNFEGRRILKYLGFTSSEVVLGMGLFAGFTADFADFFGAESKQLGRRLTDAKAAAFGRLRQQVHGLGGNAIIGTDLDYTMFGTTLVGVVASGTAVVIESDLEAS